LFDEYGSKLTPKDNAFFIHECYTVLKKMHYIYDLYGTLCTYVTFSMLTNPRSESVNSEAQENRVEDRVKCDRKNLYADPLGNEWSVLKLRV